MCLAVSGYGGAEIIDVMYYPKWSAHFAEIGMGDFSHSFDLQGIDGSCETFVQLTAK